MFMSIYGHSDKSYCSLEENNLFVVLHVLVLLDSYFQDLDIKSNTIL